MKTLRLLFILTMTLITAVFVLYKILPTFSANKVPDPESVRGGTDMVIKNYGASIDSAASVFNLPASYLKALCMLECSGKKVFPPRFEKHVYQRLKKVQKGELLNYEHVTAEMLSDANDDALINLASSWGPFQLMGYKCLLLGIKVKDIRGENAVYYGAKWIDMSYGDYLRGKKFKDAFHIHNTGMPYPQNGSPRTYDPAYCSSGIRYMEYFDR